jgi:hypothetical protein
MAKSLECFASPLKTVCPRPFGSTTARLQGESGSQLLRHLSGNPPLITAWEGENEARMNRGSMQIHYVSLAEAASQTYFRCISMVLRFAKSSGESQTPFPKAGVTTFRRWSQKSVTKLLRSWRTSWRWYTNGIISFIQRLSQTRPHRRLSY